MIIKQEPESETHNADSLEETVTEMAIQPSLLGCSAKTVQIKSLSKRKDIIGKRHPDYHLSRMCHICGQPRPLCVQI